jgi:hypothetical protein
MSPWLDLTSNCVTLAIALLRIVLNLVMFIRLLLERLVSLRLHQIIQWDEISFGQFIGRFIALWLL